MLNDNRDPTFIYTVPDEVYKVPARETHAARLVGLLDALGGAVKGETFYELIEDAFGFRQELNAAADAYRLSNTGNMPAPLGEIECKRDYDKYSAFEKSFKSAEQALRKAGRSACDPDNDAGLWVPLTNE